MNVSIFTPTHDTKFLLDAYESIKDQDFHEWVIVYNNGAKKIEFNDPRVKEFRPDFAPEWVGPLKAYACEKATGDVLLELDHDDLLLPSAVAEVKKAFDDPKVGFVYSNTVHSTSDFKPIQRFDTRYGWQYRDFEYKGHKLDEHISFEPNPDCVSKIWFAPNHLRAFRVDSYRRAGGYNKGMRVLDDLDLMCKLYQFTRFKHIDKPLYLYRVHGENSWLKHNKEIQDNVYRIHDQYAEKLVVRWCDLNSLRKVELGGRFAAIPGNETVDLLSADILANLEARWPFEDSSVGMVRAIDIFEHLRDPVFTMKELYRILAPGGWAFIQVPSTDGRGAFQDPTHKSFWNENSFKYYTNSFFAKYIDFPVRFQAARLFTTDKNNDGVCWVVAHLVSLKDGYRPAGLIEI